MSINDASPADWDRVATVARQSTMDTQVGGSHYTDQGIQPLEVTYENFGYYGVRASLYTKVNKYLTRNKGNHLQDLEKAKHCIELQIEFAKRGNAGG
jgi:hypothetical protein